MPLPQFQSMLLGRKVAPFDQPDWLFEIKHDGFRALAVIIDGECTLLSRNGNEFKSFEGLRLGLPKDVRVRSALLDGEIACLDSTGRSVFNDLFCRRREPVFVAFDVLSVKGEDLLHLPLLERKAELRRVLKPKPVWSLFCGHVEGSGPELFELACQHDLEGIVAKHKFGAYVAGREETTWFKIRNRSYSQWAGREELFERERERNPDAVGAWDSCVAACDGGNAAIEKLLAKLTGWEWNHPLQARSRQTQSNNVLSSGCTASAATFGGQ